MLVFLDESFSKHKQSDTQFGVLGGIAIPEDVFAEFQKGIYGVRVPYHGLFLREDHEIHGASLLGKATLKNRDKGRPSYQWNLAEELIQYTARSRFNIHTFAVVCFRDDLLSFSCGDELKLAVTYRNLFERIDLMMKQKFPGRTAKLIFDDRGHQHNMASARAITNYFIRSPVGLGYDSILKVPFFAVSQGHNYGLQIADLVARIIMIRFSGDRRADALWLCVKKMLFRGKLGGRAITGMKLIK